MIAIMKQEWKMNLKGLLIWSLSVGGMGFACILLYTSMEGEMAAMADMFSRLGAFSDAFGMSTLSIATIGGFFATEVGAIHGLGSAMYAAFFASCMLSKEEDGHTGEFLFALPVSRGKIVCAKGIAILINLIVFTMICGVFYVLGFLCLGEEVPAKELTRFLCSMLFMNIELGTISFFISAISSRNRMGLGLGAALFVYAYDLIGRVVPAMKEYLFIGPFSYVNASEIFAGQDSPQYSIPVAVIITLVCAAGTFAGYLKKDLAS